MYYEQLWGPGLRHANWLINNRPWSDRAAPVERLSGQLVARHPDMHVFGAYVLYKIPSASKSGKCIYPVLRSTLGYTILLYPIYLSGLFPVLLITTSW